MLKKYILKVVGNSSKDKYDFWETIESREATWYTGTPDNITDNCCFEIQYNKHLNSFRLNCIGYKPHDHSYYVTMSKAVAKLNSDKNDMRDALDAVKEIFKK